jgi:transcriptional regulator with XRE-family HTH domain
MSRRFTLSHYLERAVRQALQLAIEATGLSHSDLARRFEVTQSTVTRWVHGQTTPMRMSMLLPVLESHLDEIEERVGRGRAAVRAIQRAIELEEGALDIGHREYLKQLEGVLDDLEAVIGKGEKEPGGGQ